jgi:hypothetical protein
MQCEVFESRLNQILDRRARPESDPRLLAHAQACESCRELLAAQELLLDGLDQLESPDVSPGFAQRVVAGLAPSQGYSSSRSPARWLVFLAGLAATLVIGLAAGQWLSSSHSQVGGSGNEARPGGTPRALAVTTPAPSPSGAAPKAVKSPTSAGGDRALASNEDYRGLLENLAQHLPDVPRDQLETVEQIPGGLRPIATSFNVAIGLLRRTLPGGKDDPAAPPKPQAVWPLTDVLHHVA